MRDFAPLILIFMVSILLSQVPRTINYQGKLTDPDGVAIDAPVDIDFTIYDVPSGGTALWTESHSAVTINQGLFDVILGSTISLELPFDDQYWLELEVDGEILSPRQPLTVVPYAFRALNADTAYVISGGTVNVTVRIDGDGTTEHPLDIAQQGATTGQILKWDGTDWTPADDAGGTDDQTDVEVPLTSTGDFIVISGETEVHGALNDLDAVVATNQNDISAHITADSDFDPTNEYNSSMSWDDGSNIVSVTDAGGTQSVEITGFVDGTHNHALTIEGDADGTGTVAGTLAVTVDAIQGNPVEPAAPSPGDILKWDGTDWGPAIDEYIDDDSDIDNEAQILEGTGTSSILLTPVGTTGGGTITFTGSGGAAVSRVDNTITIDASGAGEFNQTIITGPGVSGAESPGTDENFTILVNTGDGIQIIGDDVSVSAADIVGTGLVESSNNLNVDFAGTGVATTVSRSDHNHGGTYDNYTSWNLRANADASTDITSGETVSFTGTGGVTVSRSTNTITIDGSSSGDGNNYVDGISFDTGTGVLTLTRSGLSNLNQDLDGRYLTSEIDGSTSNELQNINTTGTGLSSSGSGTMNLSVTLNSGNTSGQIPISNGILNTNLNADMLDGHHWSEISVPSDNVTGSGAANYVTYWNGTNTVTGESSLYWNPSSNRLGIGTSSPSYNLDVSGTSRLNGDFYNQEAAYGQSLTYTYAVTWTTLHTLNITTHGTGISGSLILLNASIYCLAYGWIAMRITRDGSEIAYFEDYAGDYSSGSASHTMSFSWIDEPSAGAHTYVLQYGGYSAGAIDNYSFSAIEIKR